MEDELYYQALDLLCSLIAVPSVSRDERDATDLLERHLRADGIEVERVGNNLILRDPYFDAGRKTLLLNSHIDTVKPAAGWTRDPLTAEIDYESGRLYGLGSNDAGGPLVTLLAAFRYMLPRARSFNMMMVVSAEEEVGGVDGISSVIPSLPPIAAAIVGEPTRMHPAIAEKGLMVLDGLVTGKSGHAARNEGINAIYRALPVIERLRTLRLPRESVMLGPVKLSVTQIDAGTQHNVVPDTCRFVVDVRTTDAYSNVETLELIRNAVPECELTPRSTRLNPSSIAADHPMVQRLTMMGRKPFGSPTLSDQALMPWPSMKIGPGDSARSHTADEYIELDELREGIALIVKLLDGLVLPVDGAL